MNCRDGKLYNKKERERERKREREMMMINIGRQGGKNREKQIERVI